jgi:hypothetical protein
VRRVLFCRHPVHVLFIALWPALFSYVENKQSGNDLDVPAEALASDVDGSTSPPGDIRERNARLRVDYVAALAQRDDALACGDMETHRRALLRIDEIGGLFFTLNRSLVSAASSFLHGENREDHEAAAVMGLWEAFVGTDPDVANTVVRDADGGVSAASGWDPQTATFGTFSRRHVTGRAARSVSALDPKFQGVAYSTFQRIPAVREANEKLSKELGRAPSLKEIADECSMTWETVNAVLTKPPAYLSGSSDPDGLTLLDQLEQKLPNGMSEVPLELPGMQHAWAQLPIMTVCVSVLRTGLAGGRAQSVNETAELLGIGRGTVAIAHARSKDHLFVDEVVNA